MEPVFDKICGFASWKLFDLTAKIGAVGSTEEQLYSDSDYDSIKEQVEALREDHLLEEVYGVQAKLPNKEWLAAVSGKSNWVFNSVELRKKLFELASIDNVHC